MKYLGDKTPVGKIDETTAERIVMGVMDIHEFPRICHCLYCGGYNLVEKSDKLNKVLTLYDRETVVVISVDCYGCGNIVKLFHHSTHV